MFLLEISNKKEVNPIWSHLNNNRIFAMRHFKMNETYLRRKNSLFIISISLTQTVTPNFAYIFYNLRSSPRCFWRQFICFSVRLLFLDQLKNKKQKWTFLGCLPVWRRKAFSQTKTATTNANKDIKIYVPKIKTKKNRSNINKRKRQAESNNIRWIRM